MGRPDFLTAFLDSPNGGSRSPFGLLGAIAVDGRFCGLKAARLSRLPHSHGLEFLAASRGRTRWAKGIGIFHRFPPLFTRCDRGPVALRGGRGTAATVSGALPLFHRGLLVPTPA